MVFLGWSHCLLKQFPRGANRGLYAGKGIMHGHKVTFSNKKTKRAWRPNVQKKLFYSDIFGMKLQLRVTTAAMRCIDKAGGFDSYVYHTPDKKLASELGVAMKHRMHEMVMKDSRKSAPPLVKRYPRPPRGFVQPGAGGAARDEILDEGMVLLGGVFRLLGHYNLSAYQRAMARRAGIEDLLPLTTLNRKKSRTREPAIGWKRCYRSVLLQRTLRLRVTLATQRLINRVGGFDRYIYYTPEEELRSPLARTLKHRMNDLVAKHPAVEPPRLDKRNPKPVPKNLCAGLKPVEVCNMTRFVYLG